MTPVSGWLLWLVVALAAVAPTEGYGFKNCIEDQRLRHTNFKCLYRQEDNVSAIVADLPLSVTNLTICNNPIKNLHKQAFARFTELRGLRLDHNTLTSIDEHAFQNLHQLRSLNLSFNSISLLSPSVFKDLHNLTFLSLTQNRLRQLPARLFSTVFSLEMLIIRQNFLSNFSLIAESVSHLTHIKILDLCFNNLTSLRHSNVSLPKSLTTLYVCRNNLSTLGCKPSFLSLVHVLDLSYNPRLTTLTFKSLNLSQIFYLRLRSTSVSAVELLNISNIHPSRIDFSGMGLKNDSLLADLCKALSKKVKRIRNLSLSDNGINAISHHALNNCSQITGTLDLSLNKLKTERCLGFLVGQTYIKKFITEHNHLTALKSCKKTTVFPMLEELSYRYNRILSISPFAFNRTPNIKTLKLNINTIAYLDRKALSGLKRLETLRLDNNLLTDLFNDTFVDLHNLQTLNLRNNRIAVIFNRTFASLGRLNILDLGGNKITHFEAAGLEGLKSLSNLYLDGNNLRQIDSSQYRVFEHTLRVLDLQRNEIHYLFNQVSSPFMNLSKLTDLKLDEQLPHGLTLLPRSFFRGLHSLQSLYLTNNHISHLAADAFDDLGALRFLTLDSCCVGVTQLEPGVFKNLKNLTRLTVENMGIQNFSKDVFGNLTELRMLQLNHNVMHSIDVDALQALPKLNYLDIRNIPLTCTCENRELKNWTLSNPEVQVVYLFNLPCQSDEKSKFYNFDDKVCFIDLGKYMFLSTAAVILLFTLTPLLYVKLYWKVKYGYYVFRSWFSEQWRKLREEEENCKYDAFISYNSSDEHWVMEQLLPNLEGNGADFKLCLHHRDFEPGRYIVDNIVSAVYNSRKTICVVSRSFLQSEWCSLEIQLASYRLFDEHRDVLLLVLLEPFSDRQLSSYHRMRKDMLRKTYLQWPGSDCSDPAQAQSLFWNQLRRAMRQRGREDDNMGEYGVTANNNATEHFHENSDENYYLLP